MKVVITGVSGFIGGRLMQLARVNFGDKVTAFSSVPYEGSHIVYRNREDFALSSADLALVEEAEVLIHSGAFTPKQGSDANSVLGCNENIKFTESLLSLPWKNLKKIIFLSTIDVYASINETINEATLTEPSSLYGLSKLYCERMVALYAAERGLASHLLRVGHVYGPGEEKYAKVIPRAIHNTLTGKDVELWGDGRELRSYIFIDDVVTAIFAAVHLTKDVGVVNVVGGKTIAIRELLEELIAIGGKEVGIERRELLGLTRDFRFDNSKLKRYLLRKETKLVDGLRLEFEHMENLIRDAS